MKKKLSGLLAAVALLVSGAASMGCVFILADEPTAPKSMID
jgi:cyclic lactone autoinducer peptide